MPNLIAMMRKDARAEAMEEVETIVAHQLREYDALIENGKGEHGKPGYIRDHIWDSWNGKVFALQETIRRIRSLKDKQTEREDG